MAWRLVVLIASACLALSAHAARLRDESVMIPKGHGARRIVVIGQSQGGLATMAFGSLNPVRTPARQSGCRRSAGS